jgi:hypothetical protein
MRCNVVKLTAVSTRNVQAFMQIQRRSDERSCTPYFASALNAQLLLFTDLTHCCTTYCCTITATLLHL